MQFSFIVPVYNKEKTLSACVESLLCQPYPAFEVLLVNDGSTDGSGALCDAFAAREERVRVLHQPNAGVSAARNAGMTQAAGQYLWFVDADDTVEQDALPRLADVLDGYLYDAVLFHWRYQNPGGHTGKAVGMPPAKVKGREGLLPVLDDFLLHYGSACNKVYRADVMQKHGLHFPAGVPMNEDEIFNCGFFSYFKSLIAIGDSLYLYRQDAASATRAGRLDILDWSQNKLPYVRAFLETLDVPQNRIEGILQTKWTDNLEAQLHQLAAPAVDADSAEAAAVITRLMDAENRPLLAGRLKKDPNRLASLPYRLAFALGSPGLLRFALKIRKALRPG